MVAKEEPLLGDSGTRYDIETGLAVPFSALVMIFAIVTLDLLASTISVPVLPSYAKSLGASKFGVGLLFTAYAFGSFFCGPMLGRLADKVGRRQVLLMCLSGAGFANIFQAFAFDYWTLLAARAFSGVWASVGSTAKVYLTDICDPSDPDRRTKYMSMLSGIGPVALTVGPGIGGCLSVFGLNFPVLIDGCVTLAAALLVAVYLPPSPVDVEKSKKHAQADSASTEKTSVKVKPNMDGAVYAICAGSFFYGILFGTRISMQVVSLQAKFDISAAKVGAILMLSAVAMATMSFLGTVHVVKALSPGDQPDEKMRGLLRAVNVGDLLAGASFLGAFSVPDWRVAIVLYMSSSIGIALRMSSSDALTAMFTTADNRGAVFSNVSTAMSFGRMVGPLVAGHLAEYDPVVLPWVMSFVSVILAVLVRSVFVTLPKEGVQLGSELQTLPNERDEQFTAADYEKLGRYVMLLMKQRNLSVPEQAGPVMEAALAHLKAQQKEAHSLYKKVRAIAVAQYNHQELSLK